MYNLTNITNANTPYAIIKATNDLSGGLLVVSLLLVLAVTYLVVYKKVRFEKVFVAGMFLMSIVGVVAYGMGFVSMSVMMIPMILFFVSLPVLLMMQN